MDFLRRILGLNRAKRFAVEVDENFTSTLDIAGTQVRESWENADGTAVFILESQHNIVDVAEKIPGVRGVKAI